MLSSRISRKNWGSSHDRTIAAQQPKWMDGKIDRVVLNDILQKRKTP